MGGAEGGRWSFTGHPLGGNESPVERGWVQDVRLFLHQRSPPLMSTPAVEIMAALALDTLLIDNRGLKIILLSKV
jgi:hypothetical protein